MEFNLKDKIICAIDTDNFLHANYLIMKITDNVGMIKIGLELFCSIDTKEIITLCNGPSPIFLDLKLHDIPNTVNKTISSLRRFNISMMTVHASGGIDMMKAAVDAAEDIDIIGVTVLTSLKYKNLTDHVLELSEDALKSGLTGIVCSYKEIKSIRKRFGNELKLIVPGVKPLWYTTKIDQKRTGTPKQIIDAGADYIVVGRAITDSDDPDGMVKRINKEIGE